MNCKLQRIVGQPKAWRVMTPEEYRRDRGTFGPHRAELRYGVKDCEESAEIYVFLLPNRELGRSCDDSTIQNQYSTPNT